jgi:nicotinamide-nucleotide amidase
MATQAGIIVTGTEVLGGIISDKNGPWLAERLRELGIELKQVVIVGDRRDDLSAALKFLAEEEVDLIITSGGLGPTADDLTTEVVAEFSNRSLYLDEQLEQEIWTILERFRRRWPKHDEEAMRRSNRKQALVPDGATVLAPIGTAPGLVVPPNTDQAQPHPPILVLPGPPAELQPMWRKALETPLLSELVGRNPPYEQRVIRLFGLPESAIAVTLSEIEGEGVELDRLEITTCVRGGELEVAVVFPPAEQETFDRFLTSVREHHPEQIFSEDGSTIDQLVATALSGHTIAVAESCTGGLMAARLTELPGSSDYFLGSAVAYSNEAKSAIVGVEPELISNHGAVSIEVARALADGAITRFHSELGIGITGIAGPGGGTPEKPVGTVCISVAHKDGQRVDRTTEFPGDRATVRDRSTTLTLHMLRELLALVAL